MIGNLVAGGLLAERRLHLPGDGQRLRTSRMKPTASRRIESAPHLALENDLLAGG